jgi:mannose-6-phosphate isomerase-like protein (cupin superfamily)
MEDFPDFVKRPANRISVTSQATSGVEGYLFDGAEGSQVTFWTCHETTNSKPHVHDFDEYLIVVQGCYVLLIDDERIPVRAGEEYLVPKGLWHGGEAVAGTRIINAFGGQRATRLQEVRD